MKNGHYRDYIRTSYWSIVAKISDDEQKDVPVTVPNISASGLLFQTEKEYKEGDHVQFELDIDPLIVMPSLHLIIKSSVHIVSDRGVKDNVHTYAAKFKDISHSDRIQLDEMVRMSIAKYGVDE
jgi:hypothetical protein